MPLSVTCQCGSRLDIDEKFLGKEILCPDCQRPLPTKAPVAPPPLELPSHKRTSLLSIASLTVAVVGAFTILGSIAAIALGVLALVQIKRSPHKYTGVGLARGGIIVGAVTFWITLAWFIYPFAGIDAYARWMIYGPRTVVTPGEFIEGNAQFRDNVSIKKPNADWRQYNPPSNAGGGNANITTDDLIIVNINEDAFIAAQTLDAGEANDGESREKKALERFCRSELVNLLGKLRGVPLNPESLPPPTDRVKIAEDKEQEFHLDMRLGGHSRRFLIRWKTKDNDVRLVVLVATAKRARFDALEDDFKKAFDSVKFK